MMTTPTIATPVANSASKTFSIKNILFLTALTIIITLAVSYAIKNEIVITDENGKVTGKGEIKPKFRFGLGRK